MVILTSINIDVGAYLHKISMSVNMVSMTSSKHGLTSNRNSLTSLNLIEDCCAPVLADALPDGEAIRLAAAFKVLGDPARLRLLSLIGSRPDGEACGCELIEPLGLSQPTVSHHLKVLHEAGLLEREKRGTWVFYRVAPGSLAALGNALQVPVPATTG